MTALLAAAAGAIAGSSARKSCSPDTRSSERSAQSRRVRRSESVSRPPGVDMPTTAVRIAGNSPRASSVVAKIGTARVRSAIIGGAQACALLVDHRQW